MPSILGANTLSSGFNIANSCNFEDGSLHKAISSPSTTYTISAWFKLSNSDVAASSAGNIYLWTGGTNSGGSGAHWNNSNTQVLKFYNEGVGHGTDGTGRKYRDPSAWYNWVWKCAGGTGTLYVNGVQSGSTFSMGAINNYGDFINVGRYSNGTDYAQVTMAEFVYLDGTAATPSSFGEVDDDSGIWKPIDVSGLTFGTNGFHLDFQTAGTLGNDANGGTDLTKTGTLVQHTDTPTNNFATINPLDNHYASATLSKGNTKVATNASAEAMSTSTFAMTKGRWYFEVDFISNTGSVSRQCGITPHGSQTMSGISGKSGDVTPYTHAYSDSGNLQTGNGSGGQTALATLTSFTNGDIIGIYMDLEDMKSYWSKNGTLMNSGTGIDLTALASNGTGHYMFYVGDNNSAAQTCEANFGNGFQSLTSAVADDNGYGAFEYSPNITGDGTAKSFYSCCSKNLAEFG